MDSSNVENSRLDEKVESYGDFIQENTNNIDKKDKSDDAVNTVIVNGGDKNDSCVPPVAGGILTSAPRGNGDVLKERPDMGAADELNFSKEKNKVSFFTDGPVFPARHNGELLPSVRTNANPTKPTSPNDDKDDAKGKILFHYDVGQSEATYLKNETQQGDQEILQKTKNGGLPHSMISRSSSDQNQGEREGSEESCPDAAIGENESLAPLNASFFNCQYQTPSWIDDPLIGVPPSAMENKNTHRKTGADMRILTAYMRSLNEMRLPEAIPPDELDKYLSSFFLVVRKADGSEYEPCSLRAMLASIERYLRFKNYPLSLTRDSAFSNMRNVLKLKQQTLRSIGKGQKGQAEVTPSSLAREGKIAHLFKSQEMGPYTPSSVVFTLCFYFCMYLRLRKSTENKKLLWGDIVLCKGESGREFLTFSSQMLRRTQGSSKLNLKQRNYRVWADPSCPEKDPITIYKFYAQKRPVSMNTSFAPFYLGINVLYPTQGQLWYRPAAMGINKLNEMVRQIRDVTGIRSTSEFHGEMQVNGIASEGDSGVGDDHSPSSEIAERPDFENEMKPEIIEDNVDSESHSNMVTNSSQERYEPPLDCSQSAEMSCSYLQAIDAKPGQVVVYSDADSNDSFLPPSSFTSNNPATVPASDPRNGQDVDHELDLSKSSSADSPLNCSTRNRVSLDSEPFQPLSVRGSSPSMTLDDAKEHLMNIIRKMEAPDVAHFENWLKNVHFNQDPFSGATYRDKEDDQRKGPMSVNVRSNCNGSQCGTNITLNITLSPEALQGDGPVTVTALTSAHSQCQTPTTSHSKQATASSLGGAPASKGQPALMSGSSVSSSAIHSALDKPLDLATSPLSKASAKAISTPTQVGKAGRLAGSNGAHPSLPPSASLNPPLAKRLRLSAEQAEAYASASIMASLSSASLVNERLRLQLMQAGLGMADYGLDGKNQPMLDSTGPDALRSQMLQHYGIKSEPK